MKKILQKSAAMPDLRIIVLGCLALASVVAGRGEIITGCLFSPFCKVGDGKSGWKVGELAKELKDLQNQVFQYQLKNRFQVNLKLTDTASLLAVHLILLSTELTPAQGCKAVIVRYQISSLRDLDT